MIVDRERWDKRMPIVRDYMEVPVAKRERAERCANCGEPAVVLVRDHLYLIPRYFGTAPDVPLCAACAAARKDADFAYFQAETDKDFAEAPAGAEPRMDLRKKCWQLRHAWDFKLGGSDRQYHRVRWTEEVTPEGGHYNLWATDVEPEPHRLHAWDDSWLR